MLEGRASVVRSIALEGIGNAWAAWPEMVTFFASGFCLCAWHFCAAILASQAWSTPDRAAELIASDVVSWNAGIFIWQRGSVLDGLARHAGDISDAVARGVSEASGGGGGRPIDSVRLAGTYAEVRATSIDYALLEPASLEGAGAVVPMACGWSDIGSWAALRDRRQHDRAATVIDAGLDAEVLEVDSEGVFVHATGGRTVAAVGLRDVVIVDTPDAVLVVGADASQDVKRIVDELKGSGRSDLL